MAIDLDQNNQSLIQNHVYGFRFFHGTTPYSAFPSGHTAVIVAAMTVLWMTYPRARLLYLIMAMLVIFGLIGMNYHFVSDVIGGAFIGVMTGYYTVKLSNLNPDKKLSEELL
ncbi:MAG: phosphatase PAP2 family protein [Coxiellaceae bacterium]|nr:MAG: phosphatase PAP2 family protein [Coxiellaceae bacterium]